jgi:hypothetical protein
LELESFIKKPSDLPYCSAAETHLWTALWRGVHDAGLQSTSAGYAGVQRLILAVVVTARGLLLFWPKPGAPIELIQIVESGRKPNSPQTRQRNIRIGV